MKLKIIEVWWNDAYTKGGWYEYDRKKHHREVILVPSYGIEVDHDKDWLVLAFGYNKEANDFVGEFSIPAQMVKRKRVLKTVEV
jgi:hypothetical protein